MMNTQLTDAQCTVWESYQRMRVLLTGRISRELSQKTDLSEADYEILAALTKTPAVYFRALALRLRLGVGKSVSRTSLAVWKRADCSRAKTVPRIIAVLWFASLRPDVSARQRRASYEQAVKSYVTDEQMQALGSIATTVLTQLEEPHTS